MSELSRRQTEIGNAFGFHLRAASRFVQLSKRFHSEVRVLCDGRAADGKSILDLISLGAGCGSLLEIEINGPDAEEATAASSLRSSRRGCARTRTVGAGVNAHDLRHAASGIRRRLRRLEGTIIDWLVRAPGIHPIHEWSILG